MQPGSDSSFIKFSFSSNMLFGPVGMHHQESHPLLSCVLPMLLVYVASCLCPSFLLLHVLLVWFFLRWQPCIQHYPLHSKVL